ncbi:MAG: family 78 glycoside hydrolase catalytic domain, partial [bacterium]
MMPDARSKYSHSPVSRFVKPRRFWRPGDECRARAWGHGGAAVTVSGGKGGALVVDFGREVGGYLRVGWGRVRGGAVRFYFSECLEELEPAGDMVWEPVLERTAAFCRHVYRGRGGEPWRASRLRGGFRYVLVKPGAGTTAVMRDVDVEADFYVPERGMYPGRFECSDEG